MGELCAEFAQQWEASEARREAIAQSPYKKGPFAHIEDRAERQAARKEARTTW